ncbi:agamous-like MADS-box protein AGL61 [Corylus avellana]|uniref:agamous-like MADS-box protein AGL61 n=1 Tax=Corylus avellana TaxID=13451 RepID=UPI001E21B87C|nr:agamous-like MADS-box protein AGL61 [Corylus avellana]
MGSQKKMISKGRKSIGRQRIEIKQLEEESKKQVTFSKRRAGLFKKAAELCILCGAEVAVIAYSTHGNVFCFGHPDVGAVVDRYLTGNLCHSSESLDEVPVDDFNRQHAEAEKELEMEKKRLKEIERQAKEKVENNGGFWWEEAVDEDMGLEEMEQYLRALQEVRQKVAARVEEFRMMRASSLLSPVDMAAGGVENYFGSGNDFVIQDWEGGNGGSGFVGSHGFGYGFGHGQI